MTRKLHAKHPTLTRTAVCGVLPGFYGPLELTEVRTEVTCARCQARLNKLTHNSEKRAT